MEVGGCQLYYWSSDINLQSGISLKIKFDQYLSAPEGLSLSLYGILVAFMQVRSLLYNVMISSLCHKEPAKGFGCLELVLYGKRELA